MHSTLNPYYLELLLEDLHRRAEVRQHPPLPPRESGRVRRLAARALIRLAMLVWGPAGRPQIFLPVHPGGVVR